MKEKENSNQKTGAEVMIGNYAIARGFVEAGIELAAAYPGTPSSEILPGIVEFKRRENMNIHTEWSVNERCALEVAFGAALSGHNAVCMMKQVGLNVAFPGLLKGRKKDLKGAFVIVSCDDPGPQSSQTEQDTRLLATFFGIPVFDPASPAEAADIAYYAVQYSAEHKVPVIIRPTHRVSHAREAIPLYPVGKRTVTLQEGVQRPFNVQHSTFNVKTEQVKAAGTECVIASPQGAEILQSRSSDDSKMSNIEHRTLNVEQVLSPGPAVIIARRECILNAKLKPEEIIDISAIEKDCIGCKQCIIEFECPALVFDEEAKKVRIDDGLCIQCGMCLYACHKQEKGKKLQKQFGKHTTKPKPK